MAREVGAPRFPSMALLIYLSLLPSPMAADDPNSPRERKELEDRFLQLRPEILETLRTLLSGQVS